MLGQRLRSVSGCVRSAAAFAAPTLVAGVEVSGDHDTDGFDPARHVEDGAEPAFLEDVVVARIPRPASGILARLLDAEELETLVVVVMTPGDRRKVVATSS